jgi:microsomal dipeptidase-like Zn-dependent dipeptidase
MMARVRWLKRFLIAVSALLLLALVGFVTVAAPIIEKVRNPIQGTTRPVSERARALHKKLFVADLHADSLLWGRDLLKRGTRGHLDLPRMIDGNVALQILDVVTKTPRGMNIESNDDSTDNIKLLAIAERWPRRTWGDLLARALYQAERLRDMVKRSQGRLRLIQSATDLAEFRQDRRTDPTLAAVMLGLEGAQALRGEVDNVDVLYKAGYRVISPSHFFDTEIGGSSAGVKKGGLTDTGRAWLARMEKLKMIVDVAHASSKTIDDVLALATRPVIVSHAGVRGTCDNNRNLTDAQLDAIGKAGGLVGIGYWPVAICGEDAGAIARAIAYTGKRIGFDHVALGSDFDGAIEAPFDTTGLAQITDALLASGLDDTQVHAVMGGNVLRFLNAQLP